MMYSFGLFNCPIRHLATPVVDLLLVLTYRKLFQTDLKSSDKSQIWF